jgi:hypothetical protein
MREGMAIMVAFCIEVIILRIMKRANQTVTKWGYMADGLNLIIIKTSFLAPIKMVAKI